MIEFKEFTPNPMAPTILVDCVTGLYRISPTLIKVTFGLTSMVAGGARECIERANLVWEPHNILEANDTFTWAFKQWVNGSFGEAADNGGTHRTQ